MKLFELTISIPKEYQNSINRHDQWTVRVIAENATAAIIALQSTSKKGTYKHVHKIVELPMSELIIVDWKTPRYINIIN